MGWTTEKIRFDSRQGQEVVHRVRTGAGVQLDSDSMGNGSKATGLLSWWPLSSVQCWG